MKSLRRIVVFAIIGVGILLRLPGLADPPLDFHPTRQFRSAIIARGLSMDLLGGLPEDRRTAIETAAREQARFEPTVMEHLAAAVYHVVGHEDLVWGRSLAVVAWTLGGIALYLLATTLFSRTAAATALSIWMFLPFTIRASASFQPDPLMAALVDATLASAIAYDRRATTLRLLLLFCALTAALVVKAMAVFFVAPPLAIVLIAGRTTTKQKVLLAVVSAIAVLPAAWYYTTVDLVTDFGPFVQLLRQPQFWRDWAMMLGCVVSLPLLVFAVIGALLARGISRWFLVSSFAGYVAFGIVFTHHIHTHDYYSLPLVLTVALGMAALVDVAPQRLWRRVVATAVAGACLFAGLQAVANARDAGRRAALNAEVARYKRIGDLVHHSTRVLALDGAYGGPLAYYGYLQAVNWPLSGDFAVMSLTGASSVSAEDRLRSMRGDYFVCTIQPEFDAQPDLGAVLALRHPLIERDGTPERWNYLVYDLTRGILSAVPQKVSLFPRAGAVSAEETISLYAPDQTKWTVQMPADTALTVTPSSGAGAATLRLAATAASPGEDRHLSLTIASNDSGSVTVDVRLRAVAGPDKPPFGTIDAPPDPVSGSTTPIVFQGWALDDSSMRRVFVGYQDNARGLVVIGDAKRGGRRPDVAAVFPTSHDLDKAAWVFALDAATVQSLPRPVQLQFIAEDGAGQRTVFGRRSIR